MAIEPMAVITQDSNDTAPSWAMLDGSMMMPEPIMFTATRVVSPVSPIFLPACAISAPPPRQRLCILGEVASPCAGRAQKSRAERGFLPAAASYSP